MQELNNIILIGFMGSGKTSVGKYLAKKLDYSFKDTDELIEVEQRCSVQDIFATKGEPYFRNLETNTLIKLKGHLNRTVLSSGGGLPITEGNGELLHQLGQVVFLRTTKESIKSRLAGDMTRPLLAGDNFESKIDALLKVRVPIYESIANIIIDTDKKSFELITQEIISKLKGDA